MTDVFEPIRQEVRSLQAHLERQRQTATEFGYMDLRGPYSAIIEIEREIISLKSRLPPHAEERDGVIWLNPVTEPINPREKI